MSIIQPTRYEKRFVVMFRYYSIHVLGNYIQTAQIYLRVVINISIHVENKNKDGYPGEKKNIILTRVLRHCEGSEMSQAPLYCGRFQLPSLSNNRNL